MPDLFISYSRKDMDFVRQLFDRLNARQREAWIDWRGIEYSTKWWEEICAGIEGADNFMLGISQNAIESVYCQREIDHARKFNKRVIPLLYSQIDEVQFGGTFYAAPGKRPYEQLARSNWEYIKSLQWIDYAQINDIDTSYRTLNRSSG